jgi:hypothetical protein
MYLAATRPDLMYVLSSINRFMNCPTELHMNDVKRVHIYLKGTVDLGIMHKRNGIEKPEAYTDCGYTGDLDDRKSTFEYVFMLEAQSHGSLRVYCSFSYRDVRDGGRVRSQRATHVESCWINLACGGR